jgi:DNA (cytosine-5)-methyltransferase 1
MTASLFSDHEVAPLRPWDCAPLLIDNFAGGGGASTGIEAAFGRPVDIAVNHDEAAIAVHTANHPGTQHYCQSIFAVDPLEATQGRPVLLAWFSPDCKHHSKAKGGQPRDKNIRDMAWVVPHWIERLKNATYEGEGAPQVIMLENVEEFRQWGPLDDEGKPIKERAGEEFDLWVRQIKRHGYKVEWKELRACDYGAPTSRKRLFLIARRDGEPIVWPAPTHGRPDSVEVRTGKLAPWRTAAECIDWSIPCPSIFDRKKDLKPATCARIAAGVMRYVVKSAKPFIVPLTHGGGEGRVYDVDAPIPTVTGAHRGEMAVVSPGVVPITHTQNGPTAHSVEEPLRTITTAKGGELAATSATLIGVGGRRGQSPPLPMDVPYPTQTAKADAAIAAASMIKLRNNCVADHPEAPLDVISAGGTHHGIAAATMVQMGYGEREGQKPRTLDIRAPLGTAVAGGGKHGLVTAFLGKYHPGNVGGSLEDPLPTVTANSFVKRGGGAPPLAVTSAHLEQANTGMVGHDMREPVSTIVGKGCTQRLVETTLLEEGALPPEMMDRAVRVAAFLIKYYGNETGAHPVDDPLGTVTTRERFAVVTVTIDAVTYVIVDIGMRMLVPRELANAQSFPRTYILDPVCWYATDSGGRKYGPLPKSHQIAKIGNAVCPVMSEALCRSNFPDRCGVRLAA